MDNQEVLYEINSSDSHNVLKNCANLLSKNELVDCTIVCKDGQLQAHKVIIAASCKYMYDLFTCTSLPTPCSHPMIFLRRWKVEDFQPVLEYMYTAQVTIARRKLATILKICDELEYLELAKAIMKAVSKATRSGVRKSSKSTPTTTHIKETEPPSIELESPPPEDVDDDVEANRNSQWNSGFEDMDNQVGNGVDSKSNATASRSSTSTSSKAVSPESFVKNEIQSEDEDSQNVNEDVHNYGTQPLYSASCEGEERASNNDLSKIGKGTSVIGVVKIGNKRQRIENLEEYEELGRMKDLQSHGTSTSVHNGPFLKDTVKQEDEDDNESGEDENEDELIGLVNPGDLLEVNQDFEGLKEDNDEESPSQCPWCNETFTNVAMLQRHLRTHVNKYRPYSCEYCHNSFARSAHLKRHLRVHTGEKPYVCSVCQRAFARQDKLKGHMERHLQQLNRNDSLLSTSPKDAMTITSFSTASPRSHQIPIKVLVPSGKVGRPKLSGNTVSNQSLPSSFKLSPSSEAYLIGNSFQSSNSNGNRFEIGSTTSNGLSISLASSDSIREKSRSSSSPSSGLTVTPAPRPSPSYIQSITSRGAGTFTGFTGSNSKPKPALNYLVNYKS